MQREESGFTLIEMLIVLMILGVGFVAVLSGMATSMISSTLHRDQAQAETEVRRYAEVIKEASFQSSCPPSYGLSGYAPKATGFTAAASTLVTYVDDNGVNTATCNVGTPAMYNQQVVRVSVTSSDGKATETVDVLKRPPT